MKINEVTNNLNEIAFTRRGRQMKRAFKKGKQLISQTVEKMNVDFAEFLGVRGKSKLNQADASDIIDFLDMKQVDTSDIDPNQPLDKKKIQQIFQKKATDAINTRNLPNQTAKSTVKQTTPKFKSTRAKTPVFKTKRIDQKPASPQFKSIRQKPTNSQPPAGLS